MGFTSSFMAAVAARLDVAGVGKWSPAAAALATDTVITVKRQPPSPDRAVTLTPYVPLTTSGRPEQTLGLQIICRGLPNDPTDVDDLADAVYEALQELTDVQLGDAHVGIVWRQSHAHLDIDANGRARTTSNFFFASSHPAAQSAE